jgi:hypothetical protein
MPAGHPADDSDTVVGHATHETLAAATDAEVADVLEDEREKERQQDVRDIPG